MNKYNNYEQRNNRNQIYHTVGFAGAHPGGGFVALPQGGSTTLQASHFNKACERLRSVGRRGFVAWPEKE